MYRTSQPLSEVQGSSACPYQLNTCGTNIRALVVIVYLGTQNLSSRNDVMVVLAKCQCCRANVSQTTHSPFVLATAVACHDCQTAVCTACTDHTSKSIHTPLHVATILLASTSNVILHHVRGVCVCSHVNSRPLPEKQAPIRILVRTPRFFCILAPISGSSQNIYTPLRHTYTEYIWLVWYTPLVMHMSAFTHHPFFHLEATHLGV